MSRTGDVTLRYSNRLGRCGPPLQHLLEQGILAGTGITDNQKQLATVLHELPGFTDNFLCLANSENIGPAFKKAARSTGVLEC